MVNTSRCFSVLALFCSIVLSAADAAPTTAPRLPIESLCPQCVAREDILAPGIGFHLTISYATAAIRYHNGSIENLAKVEADEEYTNLMKYLSSSSSISPCANPQGLWDMIHCKWLQAQMCFKSSLSAPSTSPKVRKVAWLLSQLRVAVDSELGPGTCKRAVPAIANLSGLSNQDLADAMAYAGLETLPIHTTEHVPHLVGVETNAAFAGVGFGLCKDYNDPIACAKEELDSPLTHTLTISFNSASFSVSSSHMASAYTNHEVAQTTRFDLGRDYLPDSKNEQQEFWKKIHDVVIDISRISEKPPTALLILGEYGTDPELIRTLNIAFYTLMPNRISLFKWLQAFVKNQNPTTDPLFIAARGAAELAKRVQEAPQGCKEREECAENRRPPTSFQKGTNEQQQPLG